MIDALTLVLKAKALREGKAVALNTAGRWSIAEHPLVLVTALLSGEDATLLGFMCGEEGAEPEFSCILEPRNRDSQYDFFMRFGHRLRRYLLDCQERHTRPQFVVPNEATVRHLEALAHRVLGLNIGKKIEADNPALWSRHREIRMSLGAPLAFLRRRVLTPGQQLVVPATTMLTSLWTTGQSAMEDQQLATVLAWIRGCDIDDAENAGSAPRLRPEFDRDVYDKMLRRARRPDASEVEILEAFKPELRKQLVCVYDDTVLAVELARTRFRRAPHLDELSEVEDEAFTYFIETLGEEMPSRGALGGSATRTFELNEAMESIVEHLFARHDPLTRLRMRIAGELIEGTVEQQTSRAKHGDVAIKVVLHDRSGFPRQGDDLIDNRGRKLKVLETRDSDRVLILSAARGSMFAKGTELEMIDAGQSLDFIPRLREYQTALHARPSWLRDGKDPNLARRSLPLDIMARLDELAG